MITTTCNNSDPRLQLDLATGIFLAIIGFTLISMKLSITAYVALFFLLFLIASPGASSAHLTISETFPSVLERMHCNRLGNEELGNGSLLYYWAWSRRSGVALFL
jgi:hypothetical protein